MRSTLNIRITVRGRLGERLAAAFEGLESQYGEGRTDLVGEIRDRTQLFGLLTRIRDLGLELEGVLVTPTGRATDDDEGSSR